MLKHNKNKCIYCGERADFFCDATLGMTQTNGVYTGDDEHFTCDVPVCAEHKRVVGFICGRGGDTIDHCLYHIDNPTYLKPTTREEAEKERRHVRAVVRRENIKKANMRKG